jgi:hypothetical protein
MSQDNDNVQKSVQRFLETLSPDERRERIYLRPEFRDAYNEITEAHRVFQLPQYYFKHWRAVLGPVAHTLYEEIRRRTYYNPATGERRDSFYATQKDLGDEIGVKDPKTVRKALGTLEEHGFIRRDVRHYKNPKTNRPYRGADQITVYFEIPLTDEDAIKLLLTEAVRDQESVLGKKSLVRHREPRPIVDNSPVLGNSSLMRARENIPSNVSTPISTYNNVSNVIQDPGKGRGLFDLSVEERRKRDEQAYNILRELYKAAGYREDPPDDHKNMGYYRRIATLLDPSQIYQAVAATRDAALDGRANDVFRYFHGAALNIAREAGVDLGLKSGAERAARRQ